MDKTASLTAYELGQEYISVSTRRKMVRNVRWAAAGLVIVLAGLALGVTGLNFLVELLILGVGGVMLYAGGVESVRGALQPVQAVVAFEQGLLVKRGGGYDVVHWDEVTTVTQNIQRTSVNGIPVVNTHDYILTTDDAQRIKFTRWLDDIAALGTVIHREVTNRQLPAALQTLKSGGVLAFGTSLQLTSEGFINQKNGEILRWQDVQKVLVRNGFIVVRANGKRNAWKTVRLSTVPNFYLLLTIVNEAVGVNPT